MGVLGVINRIITKKRIIPIPRPINMEKQLTGRVAMITGGNSGIGYSIAQTFLINDATVIIVGRNTEKLKDAVDSLSKISSKVDSVELDLTNVEEIQRIVKSAWEKYGKIDILVNSAGMHHTESFGAISEQQYDDIMATNVKGVFFLSQEISNRMIKNNVKGNILNVSSSSGVRAAWGPYQMSKWALNGLTKGLADKLLPYDIIVNAVAPGQTATPMLNASSEDIYNPNVIGERYILPTEIAQVALFLVSDFGRIIVGDTVYASVGSGIVNSHG